MKSLLRVFGRWSLVLFLTTGLFLTGSSKSEACRMYSMISERTPLRILKEQLNTFRALGTNNNNRNGWGIGYYLNEESSRQLLWPIVRRGGPPSSLDPNYAIAVQEVMNCSPEVIMAHVRQASSGSSGIPNPQPLSEQKWLLAHNGTIQNLAVLRELISAEYLDRYPADYTNYMGIENYDSELLSIYLIKEINQFWNISGSIEAVIAGAISKLDSALGHTSQLTFLLTDGDKLWGCHYDYDIPEHTLHYSGSFYDNTWVVASEPISASSDVPWIEIPNFNLVTFKPGKQPIYTEIPHLGSKTKAINNGQVQVAKPPKVVLHANHPNPCNPETWISYEITQEADVTITIYNALGQLVRTLKLGRREPGVYLSKDRAAYWDGKDEFGQPVSSGIYFYQIKGVDFSDIRKMIVIK